MRMRSRLKVVTTVRLSKVQVSAVPALSLTVDPFRPPASSWPRASRPRTTRTYDFVVGAFRVLCYACPG